MSDILIRPATFNNGSVIILSVTRLKKQIKGLTTGHRERYKALMIMKFWEVPPRYVTLDFKVPIFMYKRLTTSFGIKRLSESMFSAKKMGK